MNADIGIWRGVEGESYKRGRAGERDKWKEREREEKRDLEERRFKRRGVIGEERQKERT